MVWCKASTNADQLHPVQILPHILQYPHFNYSQSFVNKYYNLHSPSPESMYIKLCLLPATILSSPLIGTAKYILYSFGRANARKSEQTITAALVIETNFHLFPLQQTDS